MKTKDLLLNSLRNLSRRKVRTILTIIGVLIGSTSIIIMLSMGFGMEKTAEAFMEGIGDLSSISVYPSDSFMGGPEEEGSSKGKKAIINDNTLKQLEKKEGVISAVPFMGSHEYAGGLVKGKDTAFAQVYGIDFSRLEEYGFKIAEGKSPINKNEILVGGYVDQTFMNEKDMNSSLKEINFFKDKFKLRFEIFGDGEEAKKMEYNIKVAGVLEKVMDESGYSIFVDMNYYKEIVKTLDKKSKKKTDLTKYEYAKLKMEKDADFKAVEQELRDEGYKVNSMTDYFDEIQSNTQNTKNMFLIVGAVAFIVAAIGIANTMIMSVYERTKEIGVMKVIGASIKDIRNIFLMEATFIGLIGGVLSIFLSFLVSFILNKVGAGVGVTEIIGEESQTVIASYIPIWLSFVGVLFSTLVGLLSGYLPARRATKISAIEAIRSQ